MKNKKLMAPEDGSKTPKTKFGDYVPGQAPKQAPGGFRKSNVYEFEFYWCDNV